MPELALPPGEEKMTPPPESESERACKSEREASMLRFLFFSLSLSQVSHVCSLQSSNMLQYKCSISSMRLEMCLFWS